MIETIMMLGKGDGSQQNVSNQSTSNQNTGSDNGQAEDDDLPF
jgi:hypothetical protein